MSTRRSTRNSLPTPARSVAAPSTAASTPIATAPAQVKAQLAGKIDTGSATLAMAPGLITPASMVDDQEVELETDQDEGEAIAVASGATSRSAAARKRKADPEDTDPEADSPFNSSSPASGSTQPTRPGIKRKYTLDSVSIPTRRSKLGQDKTGSSDNLTLGSPVSKNGALGDVILKSEPMDEDDDGSDPLNIKSPLQTIAAKKVPVGRASRSRVKQETAVDPELPFAIGKPTITQTSAADLALPDVKTTADTKIDIDTDMEAKPSISKGKGKAKAKAAAPAKGRGKAAAARTKANAKKPPTPDETDSAFSEAASESEFDPSKDAEGDFAMDSDQEEAQLKAAIRMSVIAGSTSASGASTPVRPRGKAAAAPAGKGKAAAKGFRKASELPRNSSKAKTAAKVKVESDADDSDFELSDGGRSLTPLTADGDDTPLGMSDEDEDDEAEGDEGTGKGTPRKGRKSKTAGSSKTRVDGYRAQEEKLKMKLGRKLTNGERNFIRLSKHHEELQNVWGDLEANIKPVVPVTMEAHPSLKLTLLPFQKESLYWMKQQEEGPWKGGMLADEMGMGKTIQTIALLLSEPRRKPSLVVAPVVALMQWKHEIETHAEGFTTCLWHGQGRMKAAELKKFDVVLVSYGTLEASFRRQQRGFKRGDVFIKEKSPMHEFEWFRVILDEAHNIKERSTNAAKAAFALQAKYRWCLSGTPLQNRVGELYSLVRFLGADPFSHYFCKKCDCKSLHWQFSDKRHCDQCKHKPMDHVCFWNTEILTPIAKYGIETGGPGHTAFKKLKILLDRMMLRRTKLERADDLGLPPRTIVVRKDYFSPEEKELYTSLFSGAKRQFSTYVAAGTVLNNYSNIFSLITRMRQMACHPDMVLRSKTGVLGKDVEEGTVCRICNDTGEDAIVSRCKHVFDRACIRQYLEMAQLKNARPECPVCHIEISIDLEQEPIDIEETGKKARQGILSRLNVDNWRSSSKLEALVEELEKLRNKDCTIKSLVFSQFVSFLDLIAFRLQRAGFNICRLEGGMTPQQRDATIQHFMKNTGVTVFLISLKAGGVALNLTEASMVFMMDSWWNPSVEYQAMDRIHRLGQKRPVTVVKLIVEDSIEKQIVELQHKKLAMTEAALSTDPDAALGKLTVEDLGFLFKL